MNPVAGAVGLSDPQLSTHRRRLLDVLNRLHNIGIQQDVDIPKIVVVGSQSAGKSSLIESISGITLPRASGTCTRCPMECRLEHSTAQWQCTVSLRFVADVSGRFLDKVRNVDFGTVIDSVQDVEERLRRAQLAVLNPSQDPQDFLNGINYPSTNESDFTKNCVSVEIKSPDVTDLSFVDLPGEPDAGLIASVSDGGRDEDVEEVTKLVTSYIANSGCIILLTVTCETDFETQGAYRLAKQYDEKGTRTIGVLTKPDRIPEGEESRWLSLIEGKRVTLKNGWFCVKQPSSRELEEGITFLEARRRGQEFFTNEAWSKLEGSRRKQLGSQAVARKLNECLMAEISRRFPELLLELREMLQKTEGLLKRLPPPPSKDSVLEMMHLIGDFTNEVHKHTEGFSHIITEPPEYENLEAPNVTNLFQPLSSAHDTFRLKIEASAPNFWPFNRTYEIVDQRPRMAVPIESHDIEVSVETFATHVKSKEPTPQPPQEWIYLNDVIEQVQKAVTRELPGYYPFHVIQDFISRSTNQWEGPSEQLNDTVYTVILKHVNDAIKRHFGKYAEGGLSQIVSSIVHGYMQRCRQSSEERIKWLLELEAHAFTLNNDRLNGDRDTILASLKAQRRPYFQPDRHFSSSEPWNPDYFALEIMATVKAYFQVASKRVIDMVPLAIDREIVRVQKGDLRDALVNGLKLTTPEAHEYCQRLLAEPAEVVARRIELQSRVERLRAAVMELETI